jgi:galactose mutarotase-like enzyme
MCVTISNNALSARISKTGAELRSLSERGSGAEYLWQADPSVWNGSAPILFPIIGGLKNDTYKLDGATYSMPAHGIVRKREWSLVSSGADRATFEIASDDQTREQYPFDFVLRASFTLDGSALQVCYKVINASRRPMLFSIGSHPAFNVPFTGGPLEHYYFHFSDPEDLPRYFFKDGMHLNETEPAFDNSRQIFLSRTLFDRGPLIFKRPRSTAVSIACSHSPKRVRVATGGTPYLALWSKGGGAPFVCIEPWCGVPDNIDTDQEFATKEGIMTLERGCTFGASYRIEILNGAGGNG